MIALGQACNLAQIKKAEIVLLSVIEEQSMMQSLFMDNTTHDLQKKVNAQLLKVAQEYAQKYNINIDAMVAKGKVYNQINEVSEMIDADLIVMGTDGQAQGGLKKFIGSNAERVVRLSRTPVITIKIPTIVNHLEPYLSINSVKMFPNLYERYDTIKNLNPLEIKLIKMKTKILKPIRPLAIVKTL